MKKIIIFSFFIFCVLYNNTEAQGIRKHYTEMTECERVDYTNALGDAYSEGYIEYYAKFYKDPEFSNDNFEVVGLNIYSDSLEIYLPWHRQFLLEFERDLQINHEYTTIPYWDYLGGSDPVGIDSQSPNSPLWQDINISELSWCNSLYGSTNENNGRVFGNGSIEDLQQNDANFGLTLTSDLSNFEFALDMANYSYHTQRWVGGIFLDPSEDNAFNFPLDFSFYSIYANTDRYWQIKETINSSSEVISVDSMIGFEQNYTNSFSDNLANIEFGLNGIHNFEVVNPQDLVDSRTIGVFYSNPTFQIAELSNYEVANKLNDHRDREIFSYQYTIEAGDGFIVPAGKKAEFKSNTVINLKPGFGAAGTSVFGAKIDNTTCDSPTAQKTTDFDNFMELEHTNNAIIYPNPFRESTFIHLALSDEHKVDIDLFDITGKKVKTIISGDFYPEGTHTIQINATDLPSGNYICEIRYGDKTESKRISLIR